MERRPDPLGQLVRPPEVEVGPCGRARTGPSSSSRVLNKFVRKAPIMKFGAARRKQANRTGGRRAAARRRRPKSRIDDRHCWLAARQQDTLCARTCYIRGTSPRRRLIANRSSASGSRRGAHATVAGRKKVANWPAGRKLTDSRARPTTSSPPNGAPSEPLILRGSRWHEICARCVAVMRAIFHFSSGPDWGSPGGSWRLLAALGGPRARRPPNVGARLLLDLPLGPARGQDAERADKTNHH